MLHKVTMLCEGMIREEDATRRDDAARGDDTIRGDEGAVLYEGTMMATQGNDRHEEDDT